VLESTFQQEISAESLVDLAEAADFYQPEQLFDRENLYFSSALHDVFRKDCFSPELWQAIPVKSMDSSQPKFSQR